MADPIETAAPRPGRAQTVPLVGLFIIGACFTLFFAKSFFLPIVFALLFSFLFGPVVRLMNRYGVPSAVGSTLVVAMVVATLALAVYTLSGPAERWLEQAPAHFERARDRLEGVLDRFRGVQRVAEQMENAAERAGAGQGADETQTVAVERPSMLNRVFGTTQALVTHTIEILFLLFFLLAAGDLFLQKIVKALPHMSDKKKAVEIAREIEVTVSTHLRNVAILCISEGVVVGLVVWWIGLPSPVLWGALAAVLELAPYFGAAAMTILLTLAGVATFETLGRILLAPGAFLLISMLQGNLMAPLLHGRELALNPFVVLVSLLFWWTIWGIPGLLVAVPITATIKVICDRTESAKPVGEFLGR